MSSLALSRTQFESTVGVLWACNCTEFVGHCNVSMEPIALFIWLSITDVFDLSEDKSCGQNLFRFVFLTLIHNTGALRPDIKKMCGNFFLLFLKSFSSKRLKIDLFCPDYNKSQIPSVCPFRACLRKAFLGPVQARPLRSYCFGRKCFSSVSPWKSQRPYQRRAEIMPNYWEENSLLMTFLIKKMQCHTNCL